MSQNTGEPLSPLAGAQNERDHTRNNQRPAYVAEDFDLLALPRPLVRQPHRTEPIRYHAPNTETPDDLHHRLQHYYRSSSTHSDSSSSPGVNDQTLHHARPRNYVFVDALRARQTALRNNRDPSDPVDAEIDPPPRAPRVTRVTRAQMNLLSVPQVSTGERYPWQRPRQSNTQDHRSDREGDRAGVSVRPEHGIFSHGLHPSNFSQSRDTNEAVHPPGRARYSRVNPEVNAFSTERHPALVHSTSRAGSSSHWPAAASGPVADVSQAQGNPYDSEGGNISHDETGIYPGLNGYLQRPQDELHPAMISSNGIDHISTTTEHLGESTEPSYLYISPGTSVSAALETIRRADAPGVRRHEAHDRPSVRSEHPLRGEVPQRPWNSARPEASRQVRFDLDTVRVSRSDRGESRRLRNRLTRDAPNQTPELSTNVPRSSAETIRRMAHPVIDDHQGEFYFSPLEGSARQRRRVSSTPLELPRDRLLHQQTMDLIAMSQMYAENQVARIAYYDMSLSERRSQHANNVRLEHIKALLVPAAAEDSDICAICQEEYAIATKARAHTEEVHSCEHCRQTYTTTPSNDAHDSCRMPVCSHIFGRGCITQWLKDHSTCPMCRARVHLP